MTIGISVFATNYLFQNETRFYHIIYLVIVAIVTLLLRHNAAKQFHTLAENVFVCELYFVKCFVQNRHRMYHLQKNGRDEIFQELDLRRSLERVRK